MHTLLTKVENSALPSVKDARQIVLSSGQVEDIITPQLTECTPKWPGGKLHSPVAKVENIVHSPVARVET